LDQVLNSQNQSSKLFNFDLKISSFIIFGFPEIHNYTELLHPHINLSQNLMERERKINKAPKVSEILKS
jgi:hypothetical protein